MNRPTLTPEVWSRRATEDVYLNTLSGHMVQARCGRCGAAYNGLPGECLQDFVNWAESHVCKQNLYTSEI